MTCSTPNQLNACVKLAARSPRSILGPAALAAAVAGLVTPAPAAAQFNVCNRTSETVSIAVGYMNGDWTTQGWYNADPGECVTPVAGTLRQRYYYVHGRSNSGMRWGGDATLCTRWPSAFTAYGDSACSADYSPTSFNQVDTGSALSFTYSLITSSGGEDMHAGIEAIRVTWRESPMLNYVMRLHNDRGSRVDFTLRCHTNGGFSKSFSMTIPGRNWTELGFLEGWDGNFVAGEYCDAYHGSEFVWRVTALNRRNGR